MDFRAGRPTKKLFPGRPKTSEKIYFRKAFPSALVLLVLHTMPCFSFAPSLCNKGFIVDDEASPLLFGTGFGSKMYGELFDMWAKISVMTGDDFSKQEVDCSQKLISRLQKCASSDLHEGVLSGLVCCILQDLCRLMEAADGKHHHCVSHQTYIPGAGAASADVTITDMDTDVTSVLSLLAIKWDYSVDFFPESQACAYAAMFRFASAIPGSCLPVFVLTKSHYQFGVASPLIGGRWCYSEIFEFRTAHGFQETDAVQLLRFAKIFKESAVISKSSSRERDTPIYDSDNKKYTVLSVIGARVLKIQECDGSEEKRDMILKLYPNLAEAKIALEKQLQVEKVLKYESTVRLIKGRGFENTGMCALIDNFYPIASKITVKHMQGLVAQIDTLQRHKMLHGDLRLPNILFMNDGVVRLIDFDWSGIIGMVHFPAMVNSDAFEAPAQSLVLGGRRIVAEFDWKCLTVIFSRLGKDRITVATKFGDQQLISSELASHFSADENLCFLLYPSGPGGLGFNLTQLGGRLKAFYSKKILTPVQRKTMKSSPDNSLSSSIEEEQ
jgi:hypothetical protein